MNTDSPLDQSEIAGIRRHAVLALILWTLAIVASLVFNYYQLKEHTIALATREAVTSINKDIAFRRWATLHGGVYVPPSPTTPPNPYLSNVPDRDVVTTEGKKLTLMNPAYIIRQFYDLFNDREGAKGHITSLKLRNRNNVPDAWEAGALKSFESGVREQIQVADFEGVPHLRVMRPLVTEKGCLKCHEDQGYKVGDVRGGISSSVPLTQYFERQRAVMTGVGEAHGGIWLLGLFAIGFIWRRSEDRAHERQLANAALVSSESKFATAFGSSPDPIAITSSEHTTIIDVNDKFCDFSGYSRAELVGQESCGFRFWAHDEERYQQFVKLVQEQGIVENFELNILIKGGLERQVQLSASNIDLDGKSCLLCTLKDVTESRRIEAALRESAQFNKFIINSVQEGIVVYDLGLHYQVWNPCMEKITGYAAGDVLGKNACELFPWLTTSGLIDAVERALLGETVTTADQKTTTRDGRVIWFSDTTSPLRASDGKIVGAIAIVTDVTARKEQEARIRHMAHFDALTNLPNRALLVDRMQLELALAERNNMMVAVCYADLDEFKPINDQHGSDLGDKLLVEVARRLKSAVRAGDTVSRISGDEFAMLLTGFDTFEVMDQVLERILEKVAAPYSVDGVQVRLSTSIGVTIFPLDSADPDTMLRHAIQAMYVAKQGGRNQFHLFNTAQDQRAQAYKKIRERVRLALAQNEFQLHYQPKVHMRTGAVVGAEALIRWQHPERGLLPPGEFLPAVDETDLIIDIGNWVLRAALTQMRQWAAVGIMLPVSVNVAARQLQQASFVQDLNKILSEFPELPAGMLELEILETTALEDVARINKLIQECHQIGVSFALDDFGTGYSSLTYLKYLSASTLKIDQSFVRDMLDNPEDLSIIESILGLAAGFRRNAIAEGVETIEHGILLMRLGCDLAQGYGISRPMPPEAMPEWIGRFQPDPAWQRSGNMYWKREDFPLLAVEVDHRRWVAAVIQSLEEGAEPFKQGTGEQDCRFGRWYYHFGLIAYGHLEGFQELEALHSQVHHTAAEMLRLREAGQVEQARALVPGLLAERDRLLDQLFAIQSKVALSKIAG